MADENKGITADKLEEMLDADSVEVKLNEGTPSPEALLAQLQKVEQQRIMIGGQELQNVLDKHGLQLAILAAGPNKSVVPITALVGPAWKPFIKPIVASKD